MTEQRGIIFLQKDKFDFYSQITDKIIEFRFVPEIIRDLEVVNVELLENLIKLFITNNNITPCNLTIVLADNSCFIKDFVLPVTASQAPQEGSGQGEVAQDEQIKQFIEHVPFEKVVSKNFPMGNGTKVLAVNQDFYESIKVSFEKSGFKADAVLPGVVFANNISSKTFLDTSLANAILQESESLRDNNLLATSSYISENKEKNENETFEKEKKPNKKDKKRLYVMLGIFAVLIVILIIVYISSLSQTV